MIAATNLIDGRSIAEEIHGQTRVRVDRLREKGIAPSLVFVRVGEDPASVVYVGMKQKTATRLGIESRTVVLPAETSETKLLAVIQQLNQDDTVHGILVQSPLPRQIDSTRIYGSVSPAKDVDGFHPLNVGKLLLGDPTGFTPCTPAGVHQLLLRSQIPLEGAEVVILGRGNIVGKPMAAILVQKGREANATVTICHSQTRELAEHCRRADILIAAMGSPEFVRGTMVREGAVVVDVGVNRIADPASKTGHRLVGDVAFAEVQPRAGKITPNPGGVGPMTIAMLLQNTVQAAENAQD